MKRREFVAGGLGLLGVGVVGATRADDLEPSVSRPDRLDGGGDAADGSADSAADASTDEGGGADAEPAGEAASIEVVSTTSGVTDVRLRLVRVRDDAVVLDHVRSFEYGERAYLSGRCERGETYVLTVAVGGGVLVRETVSPGERAEFELLDETTVSVVA